MGGSHFFGGLRRDAEPERLLLPEELRFGRLEALEPDGRLRESLVGRMLRGGALLRGLLTRGEGRGADRPDTPEPEEPEVGLSRWMVLLGAALRPRSAPVSGAAPRRVVGRG